MVSTAFLLVKSTASSLIQPVASSLINTISGKGAMRAEKGPEGGFLPLSALPLMMKAMFVKGIKRAGRGYNHMNQMDKTF